MMEIPDDGQLKVLVVDDSNLNRQYIASILIDANYLVEVAPGGLQALGMLENDRDIDLVLLDVEMPGINGYETCEIIRKDQKWKDIPVIFITGYSDIEKLIQGFAVGAQDYVIKPFNPRELLLRVSTHIQLKHKTDLIKKINRALEQKTKDITDSIVYARYLQKAIMPSESVLAECLSDHFILYKPKDIVSGDFFWFKQIKNLLYIAAADCTGHGIPGAFMSVLGVSVLNEIITKRNINTPDSILNELRRKIKRSLHQYMQESESNDGMDISFCLINFENQTLQFAGANSPLYIVRQSETESDSQLIVISPDRMPIGVHPNDTVSFTNQKIELEKGDCLYLFSDGYTSQFGGKLNKKFKSDRFKDLLLKINEHPMAKQKEILENTLVTWSGDNEQVDDILVIGIQIQK
jgi:phosphoserine phosphatase RsbU/P